MPSLVGELQRDCLNPGIGVSDLLRKALVIAEKLQIADFRAWIENELTGYRDDKALPPYRIAMTEVAAQDGWGDWRPLVFDRTKAFEMIARVKFCDPIAEVESLLRRADNGGRLTIAFTPEQTSVLRRCFGDGLLYMRFARPEDLNGILDAVRTEITKWCTKLIVDETPRDGAAAPTDEQQSGGDREIDERQRERGEGRIVRDSRKVWVVHGRNLKARDAMFTFLRAIGLEPMEWGEALALTGKGTPYTGEVLDLAFAEAQAVVVLITGDDMARLGTRFADAHDPPEETNPTPQARPNVLFEAGMAFGKCPERTVLVQLGKTRAFSDVAGRNLLYISNDVKRRQGLVDRLRIAGAAVRIENRTDWHTAGNFDDADEPPDCTEQVSEADADLKAFTEVIRDKFRHANHYTPEIGTEEDQQAQRLVKRGLLKPGPLGGYMLARYF